MRDRCLRRWVETFVVVMVGLGAEIGMVSADGPDTPTPGVVDGVKAGQLRGDQPDPRLPWAAAPPLRASEKGAAHGIVQSQDCDGGMLYDDGSAESLVWVDPGNDPFGTFLQLFTPPSYPFVFTDVCTGFTSDGVTPPPSTLSYVATIYDDQQNLLYESPTEQVSGIPVYPAVVWDSHSDNQLVVITSGSVYLGVRYSAHDGTGIGVDFDNAGSGDAWYIDSAGTWYDIPSMIDAIMIRADGYPFIPQSERAALITLYNATDGNNWWNNSGWMGPPGTECSWYGITCAGGSVVEVVLVENFLVGTVPAALEDLTNLQVLDLNGGDMGANILSGTIPAELGNLAHLTRLDLSDTNDLTGTIPPQLGSLSALVQLRLEWNQLDGTIPIQLANLSNLEQLSLFGNRLTGTIPPQLGNLSLLQRLLLDMNQLTGTIPSSIGNLSQLTMFTPQLNQLTGTIPSELGNLSNLQRLYLGNNQLSGPIPPSLGNLGQLYLMRMRHNQLSGPIPPQLGNLDNLCDLWLSNNQLDGTIPPQLGDFGSTCPGSIDVLLSFNLLSGTVPPQLENLSALEDLELAGNQLTGALPTSLMNLGNLWNVDLRWNALYSTSSALTTFINDRHSWGTTFEPTQSVAPEDLATTSEGPDSVLVTWTPIEFTANDGAYRMFYSTSPGGPFNPFADTVDKTVSSMTVDGLTPGLTYWFTAQTLTYPHANNAGTVIGDRATAVSGTTTPPAVAGVIQLSHSAYRASEGQPKPVTVRRLGGVTGAVDVLCATSPGTADAGTDFILGSEWLHWNSGDADPKTFTVQIVDDSLVEGEETANVFLSAPTGGAVLGTPSTAVVHIFDNDFSQLSGGETNASGYRPAVAVDPQGNRVVAWTEDGRDGDGLGVFAQRYDPDGNTIGAQFQVNATTAGDQHSPAAAFTAAGGFVVAWISSPGVALQGGNGIFGRLFDPNGNPPPGGDLQFSSSDLDSATMVRVAVRQASGAFVVVWQGQPHTELQAGDGIFGRVFDPSGGPTTVEITVDAGASGSTMRPDVDVTDLGDTVVTWSRVDSFGWQDVYAQCYDSLLNPVGSEILVNDDTFRDQTAASVVVEDDGDFVVSWHGPSLPAGPNGDREPGADVFFRRFTGAGVPEGDPTRVNLSESNSQTEPVLALNQSGDCWLIWHQTNNGGGEGIFGRSFAGCVTPSGIETEFVDPVDLTSLRHPDFVLSNYGATTVIYVADDTNEGDGSVVGTAFGQPIGWVFADGFESGDTSAWSVTTP